MKKLFVGNIAYATSEESLRAFFEEFNPRSVKIATDSSRSTTTVKLRRLLRLATDKPSTVRRLT
jgi:RNA recognition motif-containing protein